MIKLLWFLQVLFKLHFTPFAEIGVSFLQSRDEKEALGGDKVYRDDFQKEIRTW